MVIGFWNAYNVSRSKVQINPKVFLYTIFACCFVLRIVDYVDYTKNPDQTSPDDRILSYDLLACLAPLLCMPLSGPSNPLQTVDNCCTLTSSGSLEQCLLFSEK